MKILKNIVLLFITILIGLSAKAQLEVSITGTFEGCAPQILTFGCNLSGANGNVSYSWSSGNGDVSLLAEPTFSYLTPGHYNISVTVESNGQTATANHEVVIFNGPTALFNDSAIVGCVPFQYQFSSVSEPGDAPITEWKWYFEDGTTDVGSDIWHTYTSPGIFTLTLEVTDANGCQNMKHSQMLTLSQKPDVSIYASDTHWCTAPHNVYFSSAISTDAGLGGGYEATWYFGDDSTSNEDNPMHTYMQIGNYDVSLTVVDSYGCSNTVTEADMVELGIISPDFSIPEQACLNTPMRFRSNIMDLSCQWDFGDGTPIQQGDDIFHTYTQTGNYEVLFTVDPNGQCQQSRVFNIEVVEVQASFRTEPEDLFSCTYPFVVNFISTSIGENLTYTYIFDDTYLGFSEECAHAYSRNGRFTPSLYVSSPGGCTSRFTGPEIVINQPAAGLYSSDDGGCAPYTITFTNSSEYTSNSAIVDFLWNFDDGTSINTTTPSVSHIYSEVGIFHPYLTITDTSGCTATSDLLDASGIMTGTQVSPENFGVTNTMHHFIPRDSLCPNDPVYLYNSMAGSSDNYNYYFAISAANKIWEVQSINTYRPYTFSVDTGWNNVGIVVEYQNCRSDVVPWDSIYVKPPITHVASYYDCSSPFDYSFKVVENRGAQYWEWLIYDTDRGDSLFFDPHSTTDSIAFTFQLYGHYACKFTAHNDDSGCENSYTINCNVMPPSFTWVLSSDTLCIYNILSAIVIYAPDFTEVAFDWENSGDPSQLHWIPITGVIDSRHQYEQSGVYDVVAYCRMPNGCTYSFTKQVYVVDIYPTITPNNTVAGCAPTTFDFEITDNNSDEQIYSVAWYFGDGSEPIQGESVQHTYTNAGTYNVSVLLMTMHGCQFTRVYNNRVKVFETPNAEIDFDYNICLGSEQIFTSEASDAWHEWDFGDGTLAEGSSGHITHQYAQAGNYTISHVASMRNNGTNVCSDTATYENAVTVERIISAAFSLDSLSYNCYPVCPTIHNSVQVEPENTYLQYNWNMGNGNILNINTPRHLYTLPGTYDINLEILSSGGCSSSYTQTVEISGPAADISISDTVICAGGTVHFAMTNIVDVDSFVWVVGGGYSYYSENVDHQYGYVPQSGYFPVTLSLQNENCTVEFAEQVYVYKIMADFSLVDTAGNTIVDGSCSPLEGNLTYLGPANAEEQWYVNGVPYSSGNSVFWTNTSSTTDLLNVVSLAITDSLGCIDSISRQYLVYRSPEAYTSNDTTICKGNKTQIFAYGGTSYYWSLPIDDSAQVQTISPNEATIYHVYTFNEKGCMTMDSILVKVLYPYEAEISQQAFGINIGDTATAVVVANTDLDCYISPEEYSFTGNCDSIRLFPLENTNFTLILRDTLGCIETSFDIFVGVDMKLTLDVPAAFTPTSVGDGNNIVYVRGLGIKKLRQFRIFNRWGEEIFFTDDLHTGWDGTIGGKIQNQDTYSYYVEAEMFDGSVKTKKGNIVLIK